MKKFKKYFQRAGKAVKSKCLKHTVAIVIIVVWFLSGYVTMFDNMRWNWDVEAAEADVDATAHITQATHNGQAPTVVVVSNTTAYVFYRDSGGQCGYSKTTTLNAATPTWGAQVQIDSQTDCVHVAVWYDQWTPGDTTGTNIHIITADTSADDLFYNRLDTSTDTRLLTATPIAISSTPAPVLTNTLTDAGTTPTIVKATNGVIYAGVKDSSVSYIHKCSTTCQTGSNWTDESPSFETGTYALNDNDAMLLMPQPDGDLLYIEYHDGTDDMIWKLYDRSADTWSTFTAYDTAAQNNTVYDGAFGATIDRSTYEVYFVYGSTISTVGGNDDDIRGARFNPQTGTMTAITDVITNAAGGITNAKISLDESSGTLYAAYINRTTGGTAATGHVYYKTSTDKGVTWSAQSAALSTTTDDMYGLQVPILSREHMYVTWYDLAADDINGNTIADLTPITSSIEQAVYRVFTNVNSADVGSALAASNTVGVLTTKGQAFRIRLLLKVTTANLAINGQAFKLQFADKGGGACSTSTLVYQDVTTTSSLAYNNNATPTDGSVLTANANDPVNGGDTIVNQTYEEANSFTNSQGAINTGQNGKWDYALYDRDGTASATYCFRVVKNGGDSLNTLTVFPEVTIAANPVYAQSNFRLYTNADSTDVGAALAAQNTNYTLASTNLAFRLRMLITAGTAGVAANGANFKLQYAVKGVGTCSAPTGSYTDITTTTPLAYNGNATPADGAALTNNVNDPTSSNTIRDQTYEELNNFSNTQTDIGANEDGKWDFALFDFDMESGSVYCLRAVKSDGTALTTYNQYPEITPDPDPIDRTPSVTGPDHLGTSPTSVFISDQVGYFFYIDANLTAVYKKTTNGGTTWGSSVTVDSQTDVVGLAVWYDRWTPGDSSGTNIYIMTADSGNDDLWYTALNTSGDTLSTTVSTVVNSAQSGSFASQESHGSITKGTTGTIYMGIVDSTDNFVVECSTTCATGTNWTESGTLTMTAANNALILMPLAAGDLLAIQWDRSGNVLNSKTMTDSTNTWSGLAVIDATNNDNTTYSGGIGATLNKDTNAVYLVSVDDANSLGTDDDIHMYTYTGTWATNTDVITNTARGITDAKIARDENTGDLYAAYIVRTTAATASTGTIYYKVSTDNGATWGTEQGPVSLASGDLYASRMNIMSDERIYLTYDDSVEDTLYGATIVDLVPPIPTGITFVQSEIDANTTTGTSNAVTFASSVTAGNLIVVAVSLWNPNSDAAVSSITDNKGNTYFLAVDDPVGQNGGTEPLAIYYAYNVTGGSSFQVTVNTANSSYITVAINEYAGATTTDPLDKTAHDNAVGAASTNGNSGNTATTAQADELIFGAFNHLSTDTTAAAGSGFTMREFNNDNTNSETLYTEDKSVTSTGTYNATLTFAGSVEWRAAVATFKAAGADDTPTNDQLMRHGKFFNTGGEEQPFTF